MMYHKYKRLPLRPLRRRDIAMFYFSAPKVESAVRKMARYLNSHLQLTNDLFAVGFRHGKTWFSVEEVRVLKKHLGH